MDLPKSFRFASISAALLAVTLVLPSAHAQQAASRDPAAVKAGNYKIDPDHTQITFSLSHLGFSEFSGQFSGASGSLKIDPAKPEASQLKVTVSAASIQTTVPELTEKLKGKEWFDTAAYPQATFNASKITPTGADTATISGDLTLHGVTKPVTLTARLVGSGINPIDKAVTVGFQAKGTIKRGDFGIKQYLPVLGDDVQLLIDAAFVLE
ncbi:polyisoprenoid-binding protein [Tardiphaga alba]|uniref:Polyisoprenoid-binding protein n=1 Tax=Tardiphaga alba TaxID=340268 RepID=A0ABX8AB12_9BRAD|nr:YceI family protein [Tardiphaga alba]QUS40843.1 polyisoprenoid-binding protein [Tardiphaga alba]